MPIFVLSRLLSSLWVSRTGSASDWCALQEALYKCIDTIQYNIRHLGCESHLLGGGLVGLIVHMVDLKWEELDLRSGGIWLNLSTAKREVGSRHGFE